MNVEQLIAYLEDQDPQAEVRIAIQPSWPLQSTVAAVVGSDELSFDDPDEEGEDEDVDAPVVWIVEGRQCEAPYAPRGVFGR